MGKSAISSRRGIAAGLWLKKYIEEDGKMSAYRCMVCGYIYDPDEGESGSGIEPGTAFEDLPDGWVCPECGAPKDQFERIG